MGTCLSTCPPIFNLTRFIMSIFLFAALVFMIPPTVWATIQAVHTAQCALARKRHKRGLRRAYARLYNTRLPKLGDTARREWEKSLRYHMRELDILT